MYSNTDTTDAFADTDVNTFRINFILFYQNKWLITILIDMYIYRY